MDYVINKGKSYLGISGSRYKVFGKIEQAAVFHTQKEAQAAKETAKRQGCIGNGNKWEAVPKDAGKQKKKKKEKKQAGSTPGGARNRKSAECVISKKEGGKKKETQKPVSIEKADAEMKNRQNQDTALQDAETAYTRQTGTSKDIDAIVCAFQKEITEKKEESSQKLKKAEKYITDFYHLYEFIDFENPEISAQNILSLSMKFQKALRGRRRQKDNLMKIHALSRYQKHLEDVMEKYTDMETRRYVPRIIPELFDVISRMDEGIYSSIYTDFSDAYSTLQNENPSILHLSTAQNNSRKPGILTQLASRKKEWHGTVSVKHKTRRRRAVGRPVIHKKGLQAFHASRKS